MKAGVRTGCCVALAAVAVLPTAASAATSVEAFPPSRDVAGGIFVRGDARGSSVRIGLDSSAGEYTVRDARRPLKLRTGEAGPRDCRLVSRHLARCPVPVRDEAKAAVTVRLRGGADQLFPAPSLTSPIAVNGGTGIDEINAGPAGDVMSGGPGVDVLRGFGGDDNLTGGEGDTLLAGDGDDVLLADYGTRESEIDCGAGEDRLSSDPDDVEPVGCEIVD